VLPLHFFGQDLVLFRTQSGVPQLLDAHCPHLGAHLGHGGCVKGEDILCPFHAWRFNGAGQCTGIPYAQKVPRQAKLRSWPVREAQGLILAWHHAEGRPPIGPIFPGANDGSWSPGNWLRWKARTHVQEILENAVDSAHFRFVHGSATDPKCELSITEQGVLRSEVHAALDIQGGNDPDKLLPSYTDIRALGLGLVLAYTRVGPAEFLIFECVTPVDEEFVDIRTRVQVKRLPSDEMTAALESQSAQNVAENIRRDIDLWETKVYRNPPLLCDGDGPISLARRWARQFYSGKVDSESTDTEQVA
jgi:nitrite reductase/ring-hydroxylating ferredoxin subunit